MRTKSAKPWQTISQDHFQYSHNAKVLFVVTEKSVQEGDKELEILKQVNSDYLEPSINRETFSTSQ